VHEGIRKSRRTTGTDCVVEITVGLDRSRSTHRRFLRSLGRAAAMSAIAALVGSAPIACAPTSPNPRPGIEHVRPSVPDESLSTRLVLRLNERRLYLMDGTSPTAVESFPIAIGRPDHETPTGRFTIEEKIEHPAYDRIDPNDRRRVLEHVPPGPGNPLGERWMTFAHGDGWSVGIHGTPQPELLGRAVSGGCIRMRNTDVIRLYDRVRLGTTVVVEP
jgi:lipoprotein-anchoring transpeptidase ErfK/SrfK